MRSSSAWIRGLKVGSIGGGRRAWCGSSGTVKRSAAMRASAASRSGFVGSGSTSEEKLDGQLSLGSEEWLWFVCLVCGKVVCARDGLCLHGSDSWTVVIEGMVGGRVGNSRLWNCDELLLSSGGRRKVSFGQSRGSDGSGMVVC